MNDDKLKELKKNIYITIPISDSTRQTVLDLITAYRQWEKRYDALIKVGADHCVVLWSYTYNHVVSSSTNHVANME